MKNINLSSILKKHTEGWLAFSPDNRRLVATGKTLKEVLKKSREKGIKDPSVLKAAPFQAMFAG